MEPPDSQLAIMESSKISDSKSTQQNLLLENNKLEEISAKTDLGVKRSSEPDLISQNASDNDFKVKRFSQPELVGERPLKSDLKTVDTFKDSKVASPNTNITQKSMSNVKLPNTSSKQLIQPKVKSSTPNTNTVQSEIERPVPEVSNSSVENVIVRNSHEPLMTISKITPIIMQPATVDQIAVAKTTPSGNKATPAELKKDSKDIDKDSAVSELDAMQLKSSSIQKAFEVEQISKTGTGLVETDNKSSVSDSGFGSEYSVRTIKTDQSSQSVTEDRLQASELSDTESLATHKSRQQFYMADKNSLKSSTSNIERTKLFEIKSPTGSRSHTPSSRKGSMQSDSQNPVIVDGSRKMGPSKKQGKLGGGIDSAPSCST